MKVLHELGALAICWATLSTHHMMRTMSSLQTPWFYRKLMDAVELRTQEYGMKAFEVIEHDMPKHIATSMRRGRDEDVVRARPH